MGEVAVIRRAPDPKLFADAEIVQHSLYYDLEDAPDGPHAQKRRADFHAGRLCATAALELLSISGVKVGVGPDQEPSWPTGIVGTITHSHGFASAAVARSSRLAGIGIDREAWITADAFPEVVDRVTSEPELQRIIACTRWPAARALTLVFSAKEALFKCLFSRVGRVFDFSEAELLSVDVESRVFSIRAGLPERFELKGMFDLDPDCLTCGIVR